MVPPFPRGRRRRKSPGHAIFSNLSAEGQSEMEGIRVERRGGGRNVRKRLSAVGGRLALLDFRLPCVGLVVGEVLAVGGHEVEMALEDEQVLGVFDFGLARE